MSLNTKSPYKLLTATAHMCLLHVKLFSDWFVEVCRHVCGALLAPSPGPDLISCWLLAMVAAIQPQNYVWELNFASQARTTELAIIKLCSGGSHEICFGSLLANSIYCCPPQRRFVHCTREAKCRSRAGGLAFAWINFSRTIAVLRIWSGNDDE